MLSDLTSVFSTSFDLNLFNTFRDNHQSKITRQIQITGGDFAQGMDIWNPANGSVINGAVNQLPQEAGFPATQGLKLYGLVSVNYNTELIFTGGNIGPTPVRLADVWSFKYYKNSWTKLGVLSDVISQHTNFLVYNITCPGFL